jgi:hypothetical protein
MWKASQLVASVLLLVAIFLVDEIHAWSFASGNALVRSSSRRITCRPPAALSMKTPVLDDWKLLNNGRVQGTITNHPSIPDGDRITTSPISRPDTAVSKKVVSTRSGSKYQLGMPATAVKLTPSLNEKAKITVAELQRRSRVEYDLTGESVGDENSRLYLLSGRPVKSTSGKSNIYKAFRADKDGLPVGDSLTCKLSQNAEAIEREAKNYEKITKSGLARGQFVQLVDFFPTASTTTKKFRNLSALVMERGSLDLKRYLQMNGALQGKDLRNAASAAAQCLQAVHQSGLVWTDMKTENFVMTDKGAVKGIDLESAMPVRDNPVDYSPEATPPEFATAFLEGDGPYFVLEYNYDMWSLGMLLFELATGSGYFQGQTPMKITKALRASPKIDLSEIDGVDSKLKDLMQQCLQTDPRKRPNIAQVLLHPYFLTSGIGPWSFF